MATTVLRDVIKCECGKEMFPASFDKAKKLVGFRCSDPTCGKKVVRSFEDIQTPTTTDFKYFCFNDDGQMTWKCQNHGYCDFDINWFVIDWQNKVDRFVETGCGACNTQEETQTFIDKALLDLMNGNNVLNRLFSKLNDDQIETLAQEVLGESIVPKDYIAAFIADFMERLNEMEFMELESYACFLADQIDFELHNEDIEEQQTYKEIEQGSQGTDIKMKAESSIERLIIQIHDDVSSEMERTARANCMTSAVQAIEEEETRLKEKRSQLDAQLQNAGIFAVSQKRELREMIAKTEKEIELQRILRGVEQDAEKTRISLIYQAMCSEPEKWMSCEQISMLDPRIGHRITVLTTLRSYLEQEIVLYREEQHIPQYKLSKLPKNMRRPIPITEESITQQCLEQIASEKGLNIDGAVTREKVRDAIVIQILDQTWNELLPSQSLSNHTGKLEKRILEVLSSESITIPEMMAKDAELSEVDYQKIYGGIRHLIVEGKVERVDINSRAYYRRIF